MENNIDNNNNTFIILSSLLHAIILFTILFILYVRVISVLETNAFKSEINDNLDDILPKTLKDNDPTQSFKNTLKNLPLDKLSEMYSNPDPVITTYNTWLKKTMLFCVIAGIILFISSCSILYFSCNKKIPLTHILIENTLIFIFVGMFEAYFFFKIAYKYVPVPPSLLIQTIYDNLKNW